VGRKLVNALPLQQNLALSGVEQPGNGPNRSAFAGPVGTNQGDNLPLLHRQRNAFQGVNMTVVGVYVFQVEHRHEGISFRRQHLSIRQKAATQDACAEKSS
jgi:hypothetical protein